jgi:hypothetical protein
LLGCVSGDSIVLVDDSLVGSFMKVSSLLMVAFIAASCGASTQGNSQEFNKSSGSLRVAQAKNGGSECPQVISCGTKNGVRKEYPTPCAAKDDGATDISPKVGPTCEASK